MKTCRHCGHGNPTRPRGLCHACFNAPGVREMYPRRGNYGVGQNIGVPALPAEPTAFAPGTPGKEAVLTERASQGVALWHPLDARLGAETSLVA